MTAPLLAVDKLSVFYDAFQAVHDVDLTVGEGEIVSIIGANGAGKSSFLKALVRQAGRVTGTARSPARTLPRYSTRDIVARGIALVPEGRKLFPSLTVHENLRIGWELGRKGDDPPRAGFRVVPGARRAARPARARIVRRTAADGRARPGAARQSAPPALRRDQPRSRAAHRQRDSTRSSRACATAASSVIVVEQDITRSLSVADRFYCFLEGEVSLSGRPADADRETIMQHYFGA